MSPKRQSQFDRLIGLLIPSSLIFVSSPGIVFGASDGPDSPAVAPPDDGTHSIFLREPLNNHADNLFAGHRSHSSHSSHRSHYSGSGGYSSSPAPAPAPAPAPRPAPAPAPRAQPVETPALPPANGFYNPAPSTPVARPAQRPSSLSEQLGEPSQVSPKPDAAPLPRRDRLTLTIMHVQLALTGLGYNIPAIDGVMSSETQEGLRQFQKDRGLKQTGTMTSESLNALDVKIAQP